MSIVNNITADFWIVKNHPKNGVYRVYYKKGRSGWDGDVTLDPDEGEGLRYEWYYKDGKRADGISKGWYKNGTMRHVMHWKNNMKNGLEVEYFGKGNVRTTGMYRNERQYGNWLTFSPDGSQYSVVTYDKFGRKSGILKEWYDMGPDKRKEYGMLGHKFVMGNEAMMTATAMSQNFILHMDTALEKWTPRKRYTIFEA